MSLSKEEVQEERFSQFINDIPGLIATETMVSGTEHVIQYRDQGGILRAEARTTRADGEITQRLIWA